MEGVPNGDMTTGVLRACASRGFWCVALGSLGNAASGRKQQGWWQQVYGGIRGFNKNE